AVSRSQLHLAQPRRDDALVLDIRRHQSNQPGLPDRDLLLVDDLRIGIARNAERQLAAVHEGVVVNIGGAGCPAVTLTCAPPPNSTPLGLMRMILPLAVRVPLIWLGEFCEMRLSAMALLLGCWKRVVSPCPMSKLLQLMMARLLVCCTVSVLPLL